MLATVSKDLYVMRRAVEVREGEREGGREGGKGSCLRNELCT